MGLKYPTFAVLPKSICISPIEMSDLPLFASVVAIKTALFI
jgi:hypothetical protein